MVSEVGFGGIPIIRLSMEEAVAVLRRALERGVTLFDTANLYMDSEDKFGVALAGERHRLVLATKSIKRDRAGVEADIHQSLTKMRTDYLDLFQFHQLSQEDDLTAITGPQGALEGVARAQEAGKIRHLGVTSHSLEMAVRLVKTGLFSTIQFPFNFVEEAAAEELFPLAREQNLGILAMKPFCGGLVDRAKVAFAYLRQFPDIIPLPGWDTVAGVDEVLDLYEQENVVTAEDRAAWRPLPRGAGGQLLPALRILPALSPGRQGHPGHALRHCGPPHGTGAGRQVCRPDHGNREGVHRMPGVRRALPLWPPHPGDHPPPPGPVRRALSGGPA